MATVYFIDFANGNDSANGTSKSTPWKLAPGMNGAAHSSNYAHATGDRFVFKGTTTWPASCFPFVINTSGGSTTLNGPSLGTDTGRDYYGVDTTWPASGWTRPIFDFQSTVLGSNNSGSGIRFTAGIGFILDNIEIKNLRASVSAANTCYSISIAAGWVRIQNCLIHDWAYTTDPTSGQDHADFGGIGSLNAFGPEVAHCTLHQAGITQKSGCATRDVSYVYSTEVYQTIQGALGGGVIHDNHFHDMPRPTDLAAHGNAIELFQPCVVYNNWIHDLNGDIASTLLYPADSLSAGQVAACYLYNNLYYNCPGPGFYTELGKNPTGVTVHVYNNTVVGVNLTVDGTNVGNNPTFRYLAANVQNNHVIGGQIALTGITNTPVSNHNLTPTSGDATAAGYAVGNLFAPTNGSAPTVNAGIDLSSVFSTDRLGVTRPQGGIWDVGAYEFGGVVDPHPNGTINSPAPSVAVTQGNSLNFSGSGTSSTNSLPLTYTWDFGGSGASQSNLQNPGSIAFNTLGTFTVTFTVKDSVNLSDLTPATCTVTVNPVVNNPVLGVTSSFNFGFVDLNTPSNGVLVVTNTGTGTLIGVATTAAPFSITSGANYSLAAGASQNVFIRYQQSVSGSIDSGSVNFTGAAGGSSTVTGRTPFDLIFGANQGVISAPFAIQSGSSVSQAVETTTPSNGGLDYFEFVAPSAGDYTITASVNAPSGGSNSFFINVDAEPTDPTMVWDIVSLTTGFEDRQVSWRGNGAFDAPQFAPKTFTLSQGKHKLYLRGREANTKIATITLNSITPPANQSPTATLTSDVNSGVGPLLVTFTLTSSDADGTVASGVLDYGDGNPTLSINSPVFSSTRTHTYGSVGSLTTYVATWTITDNGTATNASTRNITISPTPPPPPNQSPIATISATPLSGNSPLPVTFTLSASDPDDSVASAVIDYGDGVTETITSPATSLSRSHTYSNAGPGDITRTPTYTATDTHTATGTASATITISPPIAAAISVLPTSLSFGSISLTTTSDLPLVVKNVGGQTLTGGLSTSAPFSITTSPASYSLAPGASSTFNIRFTPTVYSTTSNGTLTLTGGGGASVALSGSSLANVAPIVTLDPSLNGKTLTAPANVQFAASASDSDGTITKVELFNGVSLFATQVTPPYAFQGVLSAASYSFTAKATDSGGATATTSPPVLLTVQNPVFPPPTVSISSPAQGAVFNSGDPIQIQVTSSAVISVDYLADGAHIGQDTQAPHNLTWTNASVGAHTLTVMATDNHANQTTSNPVGIVVLANPPQTDPVPFIIYVNP